MQPIIITGKWPASKEYFVASKDFCAIVRRIADLCFESSNSNTRPAVDDAYPQLCSDLQVILQYTSLIRLHDSLRVLNNNLLSPPTPLATSAAATMIWTWQLLKTYRSRSSGMPLTTSLW